MPALAVIPFILLLPILIVTPNFNRTIVVELNTDNSHLVNDTGPALFQKKLKGLATPLYAELFEGVMSFKVKIYHEYNGERIFYYTEDCTGDLNTTTDYDLATVFVIETKNDYLHEGGKFSIGCYRSDVNDTDTPILQWVSVREDNIGFHLTANNNSEHKSVVGYITPYYMRNT